MSQEKKKHKIKTDVQPADLQAFSASPSEQPVSIESDLTAEIPVEDLPGGPQPDLSSDPTPVPVEEAEFVSPPEAAEGQPEGEAIPAVEQAIAAAEQSSSPDLPPEPLTAAPILPAAAAVAEPVQAGFSRSAVVGLLIFGNLLTLILALVIGLGVLANLNDGALQFALPSDLPPLEQHISGLEASLQQVKNDQDAIRSRLDNLEALSDRVGAVERQNAQTQEDLKGQAAEIEILSSQAISLTNKIGTVAESVTEIEGQVTELQTASSRYQQFLDGLAQLLANILPEGK